MPDGSNDLPYGTVTIKASEFKARCLAAAGRWEPD